MACTGLPRRNESLETIVRNLFSPFSCIQASLQGRNWYISVLDHLVNYHNTQLNAKAKTKIKLKIVIFLEFVFTVSSIVGNTVYCTGLPTKDETSGTTVQNFFLRNSYLKLKTALVKVGVRSSLMSHSLLVTLYNLHIVHFVQHTFNTAQCTQFSK